MTASDREHPEIEALRSALQAAQQHIKALEDQLTQQQRVENSLREDRRFREVVVERAREGICVCHSIPVFPFVKFTVWNHRMTDITGYTIEQINDLGWYQTMYPDPEVQARAIARMERMREGEDIVQERWEIAHPDGEKRLLTISTSLLKDPDGVAHVLGLMHDVTAEERLREEKALARIDELTQLKNYRGFKETASLLLGLASRQAQPITVLYLDVDDFKSLNDMHGHPAGDRLLKGIGTALSETIRSTDLAGRVGGDEFSVILYGVGTSNIKVVLNRLHQRLSREMKGHGWSNGISIGAAIFRASVPDFGEALKYADALMYEAKKGGKNRLVYREYFDLGQESGHASC